MEDLTIKKELFSRLEKVVHPSCLLATNTSSLSVSAIAASCERPERVLGMHFFNPVPLMKLVEVVSGLQTDAAVAAAIFGLWVYVPARPVVGLALLAVCLVLVLAQWTAGIAAVDRWAMPRPQKWAKLLVRLCEIVLHFRRCFSLPAMSMGLVIGLLAWFAEGFGFWWLLAEIGHPLPLTTAVFIYAFAMLVGALSFLPGGLGSSEAVMFGLLVLNGVPEVTAVTATLICRLATLWFAVALGAACLARQR